MQIINLTFGISPLRVQLIDQHDCGAKRFDSIREDLQQKCYHGSFTNRLLFEISRSYWIFSHAAAEALSLHWRDLSIIALVRRSENLFTLFHFVFVWETTEIETSSRFVNLRTNAQHYARWMICQRWKVRVRQTVPNYEEGKSFSCSPTPWERLNLQALCSILELHNGNFYRHIGRKIYSRKRNWVMKKYLRFSVASNNEQNVFFISHLRLRSPDDEQWVPCASFQCDKSRA